MKTPHGHTGERSARGARLTGGVVSFVWAVWAVWATAVVTVGCSFRPPKAKVPVEVPEAFRHGGSREGAKLPEKWWRVFGDRALDRLVEKALQGNLDLKVMWARLDTARAQARVAGAGLWPSVEGNAQAGYSFSKKKRTPLGTTGGAEPSLLFGVAASYEVDIWGRVRSSRNASRREVRASRESLKAAAISLSGEVSVAWFSLLEAQGQRRLLEKQKKLNEDLLKLVALRMGFGQTGAVDLLQQRQLIESTQELLAQTAVTAKVGAVRLAVLLGRPPSADVVSEAALEKGLPELPPLPKTGVPAELLKRRPDVRAAYQKVEAANHRVAAAIADRFPKLSLTAGGQLSDDGVRDLLDNWLVNLAANLLAPIFDGGRRKAEVARTRAAAREALHSYGKTVLGALSEVEEALIKERELRRQLESVRRQLQLSEMVVKRARDNYVNGVDDYLRVLDAVLKQQNLARGELTLQRKLLDNRVALCRALAGGWKLQRPRKRERKKSGGNGKKRNTGDKP